jgi:tetratricopeptide (TPR) repeat protein
MIGVLPASWGLSHNLDKPVDEILDPKEKMGAVNSLLNVLKDLNLGILKQDINDKHGTSVAVNTLAKQHKQLKKSLELALENAVGGGILELCICISEAVKALENISTALHSLSKNKQMMQTSYKENIKKDMSLVKVCEWLLQFIQANVAMQQNNYDEAYQIFSKLTNQKKQGFQLVKECLENIHRAEIDVQLLPEIYRHLPKKIIEQCELSKIEAYTKAWIEGKKFYKINNLLSEYLEKSFIVMEKIAGKKGMPSKLYKPLLDNLSSQTSASLLSHIGGELVSLAYYEEAVDCLKTAYKALKTLPSEDVSLQLDIVYNTSLAHLHLRQYANVLEVVSQHLQQYKQDLALEKYSDVLCLKGIAYQHLNQEDEAFKCFDMALEYVGIGSITLKIGSETTRQLLKELVLKDKVEIASKLLHKVPGFDINYQINDEKDTLLHIATSSTMVKLLLDHNIHFLHENTRGITPIDNITTYRDEKSNIILVEHLIRTGINLDNKYQYGETLLHKAVSKRYANVVKLLLENKATANCKDSSDISPLQLAVSYGQTEIVEILLNHGANPNMVGRSGLTALHIAAENGNVNILKLLVDKQGNVHCENDYKSSVMHSAVIGIIGGKDTWDVITWLLEHNVDPFVANYRQQTPRDILENYDWSYAEKYDDMLELLGYYTAEGSI